MRILLGTFHFHVLTRANIFKKTLFAACIYYARVSSTISCLYMFVTFIIIIEVPFYQIIDYREARAYILDPCIQEFLSKGIYFCDN